MRDIFKDMQANVGCEYISDLPSYKRKVWQEMKQLNPHKAARIIEHIVLVLALVWAGGCTLIWNICLVFQRHGEVSLLARRINALDIEHRILAQLGVVYLFL